VRNVRRDLMKDLREFEHEKMITKMNEAGRRTTSKIDL
jgi:ribosome recycling factor